MCNHWGERGVFSLNPGLDLRRNLSTTEIKEFIDDVKSFTPFLNFSGGEPLLCPDIMELLEYAISRNLLTSLITNGTLLKDKAADLVAAGLDYLYVSLETPFATDPERRIRKCSDGGDSSGNVIEGLKHLIALRDRLKAGLPIVQIQTVIVEENQDQLLEMAKFLQREVRPDVWGIKLCSYTSEDLNEQTSQRYRNVFGVNPVHGAGFVRAFRNMNYKLIESQLKTIARSRWDFSLKLYPPIGKKGFDIRRYYEEPGSPAMDGPLHCMNPWVFIELQPNGDLSFCGSKPDYAIGNIREGKFIDIWRGQRAMNWRSFIRKELFSSCPRCFELFDFQIYKG